MRRRWYATGERWSLANRRRSRTGKRRFVSNRCRYRAGERRSLAGRRWSLAGERRYVLRDGRYVTNPHRYVRGMPRYATGEHRYVARDPVYASGRTRQFASASGPNQKSTGPETRIASAMAKTVRSGSYPKEGQSIAHSHQAGGVVRARGAGAQSCCVEAARMPATLEACVASNSHCSC
jgi:hypothetical protein